MKLLIAGNKTAKRPKAIVLLYGPRPFWSEIVGDAASRIELKTLETACVVRVEDWIIDEVPTPKMHADNGTKFRRDAFRLPMQRIDAKLEIQSVKELSIVRVGAYEEFAELKTIDRCSMIGRV